MKHCAVCGATDNEIEILEYRIIGTDVDSRERVDRKVNICLSCSAWDMDRDEKLAELANVEPKDNLLISRLDR